MSYGFQVLEPPNWKDIPEFPLEYPYLPNDQWKALTIVVQEPEIDSEGHI